MMWEDYVSGCILVDVDWCFYFSIVEMVGNFVLVDMVGILFDGWYGFIVVCMSG